MFKIIALTPGGLETISAKEVSSILNKKVDVTRGQISLYGDVTEAIKLNILARTITRVLLCIDEGKFEDLDDLKMKVSRINFKEYVCDGYTFAVRCDRSGIHDFTSVDAAREIGGVIHRNLLSQKINIRVNLENPDTEFYLRIQQNNYQLCINTSGEGLNKRGYRVYSHPAALNPVIAASMIQIVNWRRPYILLDPMCGGGTIPIEGVMKILRIPPGIFRGYHPIIKLPFVDEEDYLNIRENAIADRVNTNEILAYGIDAGKKYIEGAKLNAESAGVINNICFMVGDSRKIERFIPQGEYIFAFNPPYGIRLTRQRAISKLYRDVIEALSKIGGIEGTAITTKTSCMKEALINAGYRIIQVFNVMHGNLKTTIFHVKK